MALLDRLSGASALLTARRRLRWRSMRHCRWASSRLLRPRQTCWVSVWRVRKPGVMVQVAPALMPGTGPCQSAPSVVCQGGWPSSRASGSSICSTLERNQDAEARSCSGLGACGHSAPSSCSALPLSSRSSALDRADDRLTGRDTQRGALASATVSSAMRRRIRSCTWRCDRPADSTPPPASVRSSRRSAVHSRSGCSAGLPALSAAIGVLVSVAT